MGDVAGLKETWQLGFSFIFHPADSKPNTTYHPSPHFSFCSDRNTKHVDWEVRPRVLTNFRSLRRARLNLLYCRRGGLLCEVARVSLWFIRVSWGGISLWPRTTFSFHFPAVAQTQAGITMILLRLSVSHRPTETWFTNPPSVLQSIMNCRWL